MSPDPEYLTFRLLLNEENPSESKYYSSDINKIIEKNENNGVWELTEAPNNNATSPKPTSDDIIVYTINGPAIESDRYYETNYVANPVEGEKQLPNLKHVYDVNYTNASPTIGSWIFAQAAGGGKRKSSTKKKKMVVKRAVTRWTSTGRTTTVHQKGVSVSKTVYRSSTTGELRVKKMVARTGGGVRATYVKF